MERSIERAEQVVTLGSLCSQVIERARRAPSVIAVDGPGGAGKSTLARRIADCLGRAEIVPTDDFASWEDPVGWWPRLLEEVLEPLEAGLPISYLPYDWREHRLGERRQLRDEPFLVLEGVSSGRQEFLPHLDFVIWVETPREERLRRGLERDGEEMRQQWLEWMAEEDRYTAEQRVRERADVLVAGSPKVPHDPSQQVVLLV